MWRQLLVSLSQNGGWQLYAWQMSHNHICKLKNAPSYYTSTMNPDIQVIFSVGDKDNFDNKITDKADYFSPFFLGAD